MQVSHFHRVLDGSEGWGTSAQNLIPIDRAWQGCNIEVNAAHREREAEAAAVGAVQSYSLSHAKREEALEIRPLQLAKTCKKLALDKKAEDLLILDLRGLSSVTDFFVICHGTSRRHVQAIAENIRIGLKKRKVTEAHIEGAPEGRWIVLDYIDAIVHVFDEEMRNTYRLEHLWGDAARIE